MNLTMQNARIVLEAIEMAEDYGMFSIENMNLYLEICEAYPSLKNEYAAFCSMIPARIAQIQSKQKEQEEEKERHRQFFERIKKK